MKKETKKNRKREINCVYFWREIAENMFQER